MVEKKKKISVSGYPVLAKKNHIHRLHRVGTYILWNYADTIEKQQQKDGTGIHQKGYRKGYKHTLG